MSSFIVIYLVAVVPLCFVLLRSSRCHTLHVPLCWAAAPINTKTIEQSEKQAQKAQPVGNDRLNPRCRRILSLSSLSSHLVKPIISAAATNSIGPLLLLLGWRHFGCSFRQQGQKGEGEEDR